MFLANARIAILAVPILCTSLQADVLQVPAQFLTIQEALDTAVAGDQVLVAPGTYLENLMFPPRAIHLVSESGPEATVVDGSAQANVVLFQPGCPAGAILEGFTLTNGEAAFGAGIYCSPTAQPTIRGNHIVQNHATYDGGGIFPRPENNVTIEGNLIGWNSSVGQAGAMQSPATGSVVRNNIFVGNAAAYGGAFFARAGTSIVLENCTFFANEAPNGSVASGDGQLQLVGCVFDGHLGARFEMYGGGSVEASYSTVPNSAGQTWLGLGSVDASPQLAKPEEGDFRLRPTSPSLDAGDPAQSKLDPDGSRNDQGHTGGPYGVLRGPAWYPIAPLPEPRLNMALASVGGRLYSIAGETLVGRTRTVLAYDSTSDAWTQLPDYPGPEVRSAKAVVLNGYVYLLGGYLYNYAASDQVWRFDPRLEEWEQCTSMPEPRLSATIEVVSGRIYVLGGRSQPAWQYHSTAFVYDPTLERRGAAPPWVELASAQLPTSLGDNRGVSFDGELFTFGSYEPAKWERVMQFSPERRRWRELPDSPLTTASGAIRLGSEVFIVEFGTSKFWSWDPSEALRGECACSTFTLSRKAKKPAQLGQCASSWCPEPSALEFQPQPQLPDPTGGTGLAVMDGLIYAVGGAWPMTDSCRVFDRRSE